MDGWLTIGTKLDTKMINQQIQMLSNKLEGLEEEYDILRKADPFEGQQEQLIKLGNEIDRTRKKVNNLKTSQFQSMTEAGNSIGKVIRKVTKWGLALFGIRSMYNFLRQSASTLSQYDKQMATDIEYIRYALATTLKPIIQWILEAVYKLMNYINYIWNAWFGKPLFKDAGAKAFTDANKSAKQLEKTLTGFDEMNVLQDNRDKSGGVGTPSFDLSKLSGDIPDWIKWIAENKDLILNVTKAAALIFGAKTVAGWISNLTKFTKSSKGLAGLSSTLGKLGIIAGGIMITKIIKDQVWKEVDKMKEEFKGIREQGAKYQKEWAKNEEDINKLINTGNANRKAGNELLNKSGGIWNWINGLGYENLKTAEQVAVNIQNQIDKEVQLYKEGKLNKEQQDMVKQNIIEQVQYNSQLIQKLKENGFETQSVEKLNKRLIQNYKDMGGSVEEVKTELSYINKIKFDDKEIEVKVYGNTTSFKRAMEQAVKYGQQLVGGLGFGAAGGGGGAFGGGVSGGGARAKGGIFYPSKLPKLAVGGIINMPGRGIPYNGAYIGERGAEAVVPLTDSQQMALLGETIGRYINIAPTIPVYVGNRLVAKEIRKINAQDDFAFNR